MPDVIIPTRVITGTARRHLVNSSGDYYYRTAVNWYWHGSSISRGAFAYIGQNSMVYSDIRRLQYISRLGAKYMFDHGILDKSEKPKVYLSPETKIPRDIVRQNYKIVLDPDKADYYVYPHIDEEDVRTKKCEYIIKITVGEQIYLVLMYGAKGLTSAEQEEICNSIWKNICAGLSIDANTQPEITVIDRTLITFFPKNSVLGAQLSGTRTHTCAIMDSDLPLIGGTTLNAETADILIRQSSDQMFEAAFLNTDWKKYPLAATTITLMHCHTTSWVPSKKFISVFPHAIDMDFFDGTIPTQEDMKLAQDIFITRYGGNPDGDFVPIEKSRISMAFASPFIDKLFDHRLVLKRRKTDGTKTIETM